MRPYLWLINFIGLIVPRRLRADWRQEWEAELRYRERLLAEWDRLNWQYRGDLLWRSLGAFLDALWLQPKRMEDEMFQDLRYGWRMLVKHKGFTIVAVLSLALGIGANTALFSLVDAVLLRMLPVQEPEKLVLFEWRAGERFRAGGMRGTFIRTEPGTRGASMFRQEVVEKLRQEVLRNPQSPLSDLFSHASLWGVTSVYQKQAEAVKAQCVSGNYYAALGVNAFAGRTINEADDQAGAAPVVVLSHHYWVKSFGSDPSVIGQQLTLNQNVYTIVGVTPPGFVGALQVNSRPDVTVPIAFEPLIYGDRSAAANADRPSLWWLHMMGRLKPGRSREEARESINAMFQTLALDGMTPPKRENEVPREKLSVQEYPRLIARSGSMGAMEIRTMSSKTIYGLLAVVALVLLIACANVANLLLARASLRGPEISLRLAMGAGRWRLIRQLLTESILLSLLGGAVGIVFAFWGKAALLGLTSRFADFIPPDIELQINGRVLLFTLGISLLTGILFGLAPAWRATGLDLNSSLKQSKRSISSVSKLSKGLIVVQVALSLLLLLGAGMFLRTLRNLQQVNVGFNQENLLLFELTPGSGGYKPDQLPAFYERLSARLDAVPGVRAATFAVVPLIAFNAWNTQLLLPGEAENSSAEHIANRQMARENYFATMEIPLLRGRIFTERDNASAPLVGIVNQEFARKFFPNEDVIGKRVKDSEAKRQIEIVGVVADTKYSSQREAIDPLLYTPWRQELDDIGNVHFALRTVGDPTALANSVRQVVREFDSNLPVTEIKTQLVQADEILAQERLYARLLSFFALLALVLAAVGLSGVLAYSVAQRTNEIGIRMALGAQTRDVLRLVIWQGMKLVLIGLALGGLAAYAIKRMVVSLDSRAWQRQIADTLYGVKATDPVLLAGIAAVLLSVALLACWLPARRAARVDPLEALRME